MIIASTLEVFMDTVGPVGLPKFNYSLGTSGGLKEPYADASHVMERSQVIRFPISRMLQGSGINYK